MRRETVLGVVMAAICLAAAPTARAWPVVFYAATASDAAAAAQQLYPDATVLAVRRAPNGDFIVTIRLGNQLRRVRVDGDTGQVK
jgi:hypothetical protein